MAKVATSDAQAVVVRLLARREYSRFELTQRLRQRGYSADEYEAALDKAAAEGWQSDERFADAFVRSRIERAQGPLKIRAELRNRGVDDAVIDRSLRHQSVDWHAIACAYLQRHERFAQAPLKARQALQRRGFTGEQSRHAIRLWEEAGTDE